MDSQGIVTALNFIGFTFYFSSINGKASKNLPAYAKGFTFYFSSINGDRSPGQQKKVIKIYILL